MSTCDPAAVLAAPMGSNDTAAATVGDYLRELLSVLWEQDEGFSGKRPFGNSGWKWDVYAALVSAGLVSGSLDQDGYLDDCDDAAADDLIQKAIAHAFTTTGGAR